MPAASRRAFSASLATLLLGSNALAQVPSAQAAPAPGAASLPAVRPPSLKPGDTIGLINPSGAGFQIQRYEQATEALAALGFRAREGVNLRARYGHFAGTDSQRAADVNAFFADDTVHGLLAVGGGSGATRILPLLDYALIARKPKVIGGFSDMTALLNGIHARTGLVTFHGPFAASDWNEFDVQHWHGAVADARALTLRNPQEKADQLVPREGRIRTLRAGLARGRLIGGNLAVLAAMVGSPYMPSCAGAVLFLEDTNEYLYRVDRMLSTLRNAGHFERLAGVVLGAFTNCTPGEGFGSLTLDEIFDDYFLPLKLPVYSGAQFGHIRRKFTLPVGLDVELDAQAGTLRFLSAAVS